MEAGADAFVLERAIATDLLTAVEPVRNGRIETTKESPNPGRQRIALRGACLEVGSVVVLEGFSRRGADPMESLAHHRRTQWLSSAMIFEEERGRAHE
jgi:hypothetical protein